MPTVCGLEFKRVASYLLISHTAVAHYCTILNIFKKIFKKKKKSTTYYVTINWDIHISELLFELSKFLSSLALFFKLFLFTAWIYINGSALSIRLTKRILCYTCIRENSFFMQINFAVISSIYNVRATSRYSRSRWYRIGSFRKCSERIARAWIIL